MLKYSFVVNMVENIINPLRLEISSVCLFVAVKDVILSS